MLALLIEGVNHCNYAMVQCDPRSNNKAVGVKKHERENQRYLQNLAIPILDSDNPENYHNLLRRVNGSVDLQISLLLAPRPCY